MGEGLVAEAGVAPDLGRNSGPEAAGETVGPGTGFPVVLPEDVGGAEEPVFVEGVEGEGSPTHRDGAGAADEREIVEVDDVEGAGQDGVKGGMFEAGAAELLGEQGGEWTEPAVEAVNGNAGRGGFGGVRAGAVEAVGVFAVDDFDFVAAAGQGAGQTLHENRVAAEVVGRVIGGRHAEAQRAVSRHCLRKSKMEASCYDTPRWLAG